jgi:hypothetical protein
MATKLQAKKLIRPPAGTLRLALGVGLVMVSLAGVWFVVSESTATRTVAVSDAELIAGQSVSSSDFRALQVPEDPLFDGYASLQDVSGGAVLRRGVASGELVPLGVLSDATLIDDSVITVSLAIGQPDWLRAGAKVELWVAPTSAENSFLSPFVLSPEVTIVAVSSDEGFAADGVTTRVEILVPRRDLPGAIHAMANRYFIHLTPVNG